MAGAGGYWKTYEGAGNYRAFITRKQQRGQNVTVRARNQMSSLSWRLRDLKSEMPNVQKRYRPAREAEIARLEARQRTLTARASVGSDYSSGRRS